MSEINFDQFLADPTILPCNCDKSFFADKIHGKILTTYPRGPKYHDYIDIAICKIS